VDKNRTLPDSLWIYREYGLVASDMYIMEQKRETVLKQRVQFTLKGTLHPHVYERCQRVIESLEILKLLTSMIFAFPNQMPLPIIRCP
jgi:hypothetical protein